MDKKLIENVKNFEMLEINLIIVIFIFLETNDLLELFQ